LNLFEFLQNLEVWYYFELIQTKILEKSKALLFTRATTSQTQIPAGQLMGWQPTSWSRRAPMVHGRWLRRPIPAAAGGGVGQGGG
jgi:hypothetical protein